KTTEKPQWRATALAIAAAALVGFSASDASALGLGRITVQSALGEPLRAEIDIPEINAEELASLRTSVAAPEAFRSAGLEYNPTVSNLKITLERRADGRHFLRLVSTRPVNEPFVDLILETQWAAGRIVRDYTMLFDPPGMRTPAAPLAAQVSPAPAARPAPSVAASVAPSRTTAAPSQASPPASPPARAAAVRSPTEPRAAAAGPRAGSGDKQVTVQGGDTASKIAGQFKPASISLDQMLVALLRANPDAFINGNINRLRAGAVIDVPGSEEASRVPAGEARQTLVAQSRDFNEFRRKLAEGAPTTRAAATDRQAAGRVQAQVEEKRPAAAAPDKLQLSKGSVQARAAEDKIASERAARESATRVAELNKNIADLNRLSVASAPAGASASAARPGVAIPLGSAVGAASAARAASATATATTAAPGAAVPSVAAPLAVTASAARPASGPAVAPSASLGASAAVPATASTSPSATGAAALAPAASASANPTAALAAASAASPAASAAIAAAMASAPATGAAASSPAAGVPASAPMAGVSANAPAAVPAPVETSLIDDMLENPIVPAALGAILALLLGFGIYRAQQRKKSTQVDSSFLESRLQPDSFFGASGGQRIDTNEGGATGSSMVYSPSQLDAAGDVDPVAEADVYLAYGRDLQAEEILKEAMRTQPQRVAIHSKLLEIYSKRRDGKAFEQVAAEAHRLTQGEGPEWEHICELGKELDPSNTLYRPGGKPSAEGFATASMATQAFSTSTQPVAAAHLPASQAQPAPDFDLDLDFSLDDPVPGSSPAPLATSATERTQALSAVAPEQIPALDMDFGSEPVTLNAPPVNTPAPVSQTETVRLDAPDLMLDSNSLSFTTEPVPAPVPVAPAPMAPVSQAKPAQADAGMIEFDLDSLSLDPGPDTQSTATDEGPVSTAGSPLGADINGASDPLATKLALAEEFNAIGDPDGARSLAEEVVAEASGELKNRAQRFLTDIR
ncbi:MAG: FimV/HubP family polar landmark protein, partial [Pseudomonadota bacterium]